jgi:hypothetical protein
MKRSILCRIVWRSLVAGFIVAGLAACTAATKTSAPACLMKYVEHYNNQNGFDQFQLGCMGATEAVLEDMGNERLTAWVENGPISGVRLIFTRQKHCGIGIPKLCHLRVVPDFGKGPEILADAPFEKTGPYTYAASFPKVMCNGCAVFKFTYDGAAYAQSDGSFHFDLRVEPLNSATKPLEISRRFFVDGNMHLPFID